jgi:AraC-like DNA-binding protein
MNVPPAEWLELNEIAQRLNMSDATIQRRLKSEGVSYQQLKNDIRRDTAIEFLTKTDKTLQDISDELSFHDPSAFHRAFKKWTGVSPGAYRQLKEQ